MRRSTYSTRSAAPVVSQLTVCSEIQLQQRQMPTWRSTTSRLHFENFKFRTFHDFSGPVGTLALFLQTADSRLADRTVVWLDQLSRYIYPKTQWTFLARWPRLLILVTPVRQSTMDDRAFRVAAPRAWNSLPSSVRATTSSVIFQQELKTFLHHSSYADYQANSAHCINHLFQYLSDYVKCPCLKVPLPAGDLVSV